MTIEIKDFFTILGIGLTFFVSLASLIVSIRNSEKTAFINSVTASRVKWMTEIRKNISEFCGLNLHLSLTQIDKKEERQIVERIDILRFLIKLQLNRKENYDGKIIELIDSIPNVSEPKKFIELENQINRLTNLIQDLLKLEWEGIKSESIKGNLSKKQKDSIISKYLE